MHETKWTDSDYTNLLTATRPVTLSYTERVERPCYTHPQARVMYLNGLLLGMLIGFASGLTIRYIVAWFAA